MDIRAFRRTIRTHYRKAGRHTLPWRQTTDPYKIAVSEIMLQQTQVDRVIPKYRAFLRTFPSIGILARAPLAGVLQAWSGLGYNRRAKFLHQMAHAVVHEYRGKFPETIEGLQKLPGIGPYTARAIAAFAYNQPSVFIETNIRTIYLHHFFPNKKNVSDMELMKIIEKTLDHKNPRKWYWALMDYGALLKREGNTVHRASRHYTKQSKFHGSRRQIRGAIMRELLKDPMTVLTLTKAIAKKKEDIQSVLNDLIREGFVTKIKTKYSIK